MEKIDIFDVIENEQKTVYSIIEFTFKPKKEKINYNIITFNYNIKKQIKLFTYFIGFIKYIFTSAFIFILLLFSTNYSAYIELFNSYVHPELAQKTSANIINSVNASKISENVKNKLKQDIKVKKSINRIKSTKAQYSIKKIAFDTNKKNIKLDIDITPYDNRLIIPKIAKNIPIVEVKARKVKTANELEDIFMKELENGVVRYPGSSKPGQHGNTFIFGHSSNYPWIKGDYNEVFVNLGKLSYGDKIVVYYGQKKYTYTVKEKKVIHPGNTKILKRNENKDELTLMTCWPVGTTLNRLIIISELDK